MAELLIPIAVSSELDVTGEERIHIANYAPLTRASYVPSVFGWYLATGTQFSSGSDELTIYKQIEATFAKLPAPSPPMTGEDVMFLAFDPSGTYLAAGAGSFAPDSTVFMYKRTGDSFTRITFPTLTGSVNEVAWSPSGTHFAVTQSTSTRIYSRSGDTFTQIANLTPVAAQCIAYSPDATKFVIGNIGTNAFDIYTISGDVYTFSNSVALGTTPYSCAFTPDSSTFVISIQTSPGAYNLYSVAGTVFTFSQTLNSTQGSGRAVRYSPDGNYLAAGASSGLNVFNVPAYTLNTDTLMEFAALAVSWNDTSEYLAASGPEDPLVPCVKVFENNVGVFTELFPPDAPVSEGLSVAYSPLVELP